MIPHLRRFKESRPRARRPAGPRKAASQKGYARPLPLRQARALHQKLLELDDVDAVQLSKHHMRQSQLERNGGPGPQPHRWGRPDGRRSGPYVLDTRFSARLSSEDVVTVLPCAPGRAVRRDVSADLWARLAPSGALELALPVPPGRRARWRPARGRLDIRETL